MKKFKPLSIVLAVAVFMTSCATLIRPTTTYTSNKPTADELKIGRKTYYNVAFPFSVKAKAGYRKTHVTAKRADCETVELDVHKTFYAMTLGNILLGGVFGLGIDLLTGGVAKPQYPTYHLNFMEKYNMNKGNMNYIAQNDLVQQQQIQQLQQIQQQIQEVQQQQIQQIQQQSTDAKTATATSEKKEAVPESDVDVNIPETDSKADDTFVLIIANEHYSFVDDVDFAIHDGEIFREYCIKTLGVPERQVWFYQDASAGIISGGVGKMVQAMSLFENSKAIVYYCGHGIPDEHTGDAYIVPTDGNGKNLATCYSLNKLYTTLASSNATSVTYFMDACFSGANKEGSMLVAARGVAREAKEETLTGNTVVFSAASGDETAMTFKEKGHGLFTYFLLKKLQETSGDVSYGDLDKYIKDNVKKESFLTNDKIQTPTTNVSENAVDTWKQMKLK